MTWPYLRWLVFFVTILVLHSDWTTAAPNPNGEDIMRELLKLDEMYSSVARPRWALPSLIPQVSWGEITGSLRSGPAENEIRPKVVQRAMLRLQELDRMYSDRARPRFGKRTLHSNSQYSPLEYDTQYQRNEQDVGDWLPLRR